MAFSRKMLKALGIEDDKIETIIEEHAAVTDALKQERDGYKADAEKLDGVQKELDELKAKGDDGYKEKYEAEKKAFADYKADIESKQTHESKEKAFRELLKEANIKEAHIETIVDTRAAQAMIAELELADGKITDAEKVSEKVKASWAGYIATTTTQTAGVETPPANNGGSAKTKEQIMAIKDPATRQAEIAKNPEVFGLKFD